VALPSPSSRPSPPSTVTAGRAAEARARWHYRLRGYRILGANVRAGGVELDLVARRGRRLVVCEVKYKGGEGRGDPLEMVGPAKQERLRRGAEAWLAAHPEASELEVRFDVVAVRGRRVERVASAF
jgi:putative endonuclease